MRAPGIQVRLGWRLVRLKHLAAVRLTNGLGEAADEGRSDWPRYVRTSDIAGPRDLREDTRVSLPPRVAARAMLSPEDLLLCSAGSLDVFHLFTSREPACYAGYLTRFRADREKAVPRFVRYAVGSAPFRWQVAAGAVRSTIDNYSAMKYANTHLLAPWATCTQASIADFLDRECARVAELVFALQEYTDDLMRPALEQFRRLTAQTSLGRIGYRFQVQLGKMLDGKRTAGDARPYLRNANVHWDRLELDDLKEMAFTGAERIKFALRPGDLLVCEGGEPGRSAVWNSEIEDCYFQKALHRVRSYGTDSTRFLLWCLRDLADRGAFTSDGPGRYIHLPAEQLRAVRVPLPAADEQARVASAVDATAQRSSTIRVELQAMDRVLTEYRDALITEAVTGRLDVTRLSEQQMDESAHAAMEGERPEVLSA